MLKGRGNSLKPRGGKEKKEAESPLGTKTSMRNTQTVKRTGASTSGRLRGLEKKLSNNPARERGMPREVQERQGGEGGKGMGRLADEERKGPL